MKRETEWLTAFRFCTVFSAMMAIAFTSYPPKDLSYPWFAYNVLVPFHILLSALCFYLWLYLADRISRRPTLEDQIARGRVFITQDFYFVLNEDPRFKIDLWYIEHRGYYIGTLGSAEGGSEFGGELIKYFIENLRLYGEEGGRRD